MTRGALPPSLTGAARAVVQPRDTDGGTLHWPHPRAHHLHRAVRPVVTRAHLFTCARPHPPAPLALRRFPPRWRGPFPFVKITLPQITTRPGLASFSLTVHSEPPSPFLMGRLVSPALLRPFLLLLAPPLRYPSGCAARLLRCYDCLPIGAHPDTRAPPASAMLYTGSAVASPVCRVRTRYGTVDHGGKKRSCVAACGHACGWQTHNNVAQTAPSSAVGRQVLRGAGRRRGRGELREHPGPPQPNGPLASCSKSLGARVLHS